MTDADDTDPDCMLQWCSFLDAELTALALCRLLITPDCIQQLAALDTADAWDGATWAAAEPYLKAASTPAGQELMPQECPESCLGLLLTMLIQQVSHSSLEPSCIAGRACTAVHC